MTSQHRPKTEENTATRNQGPLSGIRVIDLTHVLNGPFCTMLLAHMGADVIKIEHGDGDRFRHSWMPPNAGRDGYESLVVNANKRAITLNLKSEKGAKMFEELLRDSDVLVENFGVETMERLGFSYERVKELNPRIVYARSSGYGKVGPYAHMPAFAVTIQAISGWTHSLWEQGKTHGAKPLGIGDEAAGVSLALGICAALVAREKTGEGDFIDISMQEAQMGFMVSSLHMLYEEQPVAVAPAACADGYFSFHMPDLDDARWHRFCAAVGQDWAIDDARFSSPLERRKNFEHVMDSVRSWIKDRTRDELWQIFVAEGIPCAPVLTMTEAVENENLIARNAMVDVEHPDAGTLRMLRPWIRFQNHDTKITHAGPAIGEHNYEVYEQLLGLDKRQVDELAEESVL